MKGILQTAPVPLWRMPQAMAYRRDARLVKGQRSRLGLQMMLPEVPRELVLDLLRPDSLLADESWLATLRVLEPHQMLILVLAKESNDAYAHWARFQAMGPPSEDRTVSDDQERRRYYRLVLPLEPDKPLVSSHPLTWTTISHVIWDGMSPDVLSSPQQQAMLDWLHWGGQLIIIGGAGPSLSALRDSFLAPYLPADPSSENGLLTREDLKPLADAYPPPSGGRDPDEPQAEPLSITEAFERFGRRYRAAVPIQPASNRPVYVAGLRPRPGATTIPLGESSDRLLGVEGRVGRGRILVLSVNPSDPALAAWPGLDTLVRRVVLRRPEEDTHLADALERPILPAADLPIAGRPRPELGPLPEPRRGLHRPRPPRVRVGRPGGIRRTRTRPLGALPPSACRPTEPASRGGGPIIVRWPSGRMNPGCRP